MGIYTIGADDRRRRCIVVLRVERVLKASDGYRNANYILPDTSTTFFVADLFEGCVK